MVATSITNKRRILEIAAVVLTAIGKFVYMDLLGGRFVFISIAIIAWIAYIIYRGRKDPAVPRYWGFRTDNFRSVMRKVLPFGLFSILVFIGIGLYQHSINLTWHIIPLLILYPVWGTIQQFLLITLTAGNLYDMKGQKMSKGLIILIAAVFFALVHYPYVWLMAGTFVLAEFYGWIFLENRNIYVLGLFHGWLGCLFFYTVVGRDPFLETFGHLLHISK